MFTEFVPMLQRRLQHGEHIITIFDSQWVFRRQIWEFHPQLCKCRRTSWSSCLWFYKLQKLTTLMLFVYLSIRYVLLLPVGSSLQPPNTSILFWFSRRTNIPPLGLTTWVESQGPNLILGDLQHSGTMLKKQMQDFTVPRTLKYTVATMRQLPM